MSKKAAGIGAAAASIVRGAVSGGPAGAAAAFLPKLIKPAVIAIVTLLALPFLILAALPNILFGYDNASANDIIRLTDKAYSIDAAYKEVENYERGAVEKIVDEAAAAYGDGFDEITVNEDLENTNIFWLIAITSVSHKQDLFTMSEESIKDMVVSKITYTTSLVDSETVATMKALKVDIKDLDPDELMDKLGFTDEERNWAEVLFTSMMGRQHTGQEDGDEFYGTDYGEITFDGAATEVVYYNQSDSRWGGESYGETGTIATSACGPASLSIVVSSLTGNTVTPKDAADWSVANGYRCEGNGSYHSLMPDGGAHYGLNVEGIGSDAEKLVEALMNGKLVIAIMARGHFTQNGHFIVIRGVTGEGNLLVADPASYTRSEQEWSVSLVINELNRAAGSGGPLWVFSN